MMGRPGTDVFNIISESIEFTKPLHTNVIMPNFTNVTESKKQLTIAQFPKNNSKEFLELVARIHR